MAYFVEYRFPDAGREEEVYYPGFLDYCMPDGSKLDILQQPVWCPACDRLTLAEKVPSIEAFEQEIETYWSGDPETLRKWAFISNGAPIENRISELSKRIEWRRKRQGPPRCLECGAVGVKPIPVEGEFIHPGTGERGIVGAHGFADIAFWCREWCTKFSPEGEPIA